MGESATWVDGLCSGTEDHRVVANAKLFFVSTFKRACAVRASASKICLVPSGRCVRLIWTGGEKFEEARPVGRRNMLLDPVVSVDI